MYKKDDMIERIVFALFILLAIVVGGVIWLIPSTGHAEITQQWEAGRFTVEKRVDTSGSWCMFTHIDGDSAYIVYRLSSGDYRMSVAFKNTKTTLQAWTGDHEVEVTIDGDGYHATASPIATYGLISGWNSVDLRHAYYNGRSMTVRAEGFQHTFDLTGSAVALTVMNTKCAPTIGVMTWDAPGQSSITAQPSAPQPYTPPAPTYTPPTYRAQGEAALVKVGHGKHFAVTITINGVATMTALLDSGATDISIGPTVGRRLIASGTITQADYAGMVEYTFADGRTRQEKTYYLRSVVIGGYTINNVRASFTDSDDNELIGTGLLAKFKQWAIDNQRSVLILTP